MLYANRGIESTSVSPSRCQNFWHARKRRTRYGVVDNHNIQHTCDDGVYPTEFQFFVTRRVQGVESFFGRRALELADPDLWQFRQELLGELSKPGFDSVRFARRTNEFVEAAGKEASARRNRTRQVIRFAIDLFRQRLRVACGLEAVGDAELCQLGGR